MEPMGARQVRRERCADQVKAGNLDLLLPARKQPLLLLYMFGNEGPL